MKNKPLIREHFFTVHTSYVVDLEFFNNITILTGDSGTGRTLVFTLIKECECIEPRLLCLNYMDFQKDIHKIISESEGKLIVIDNADILLKSDTRKHISLDDKNQYLIIGRDPSDLFATRDNLFELVSEKNDEETVFRIVPYL